MQTNGICTISMDKPLVMTMDNHYFCCKAGLSQHISTATRAMRPNGRGRARAGGFLSLLVAAEAVCDDVAVHDNQCT